MNEMDALVEAVCAHSAQAWPNRGSADPELGPPVGIETFEFVHWHLRSVQKTLRFRLPGERGRRGRAAGADLAALVDHYLVAPAPDHGYPLALVASPPD